MIHKTLYITLKIEQHEPHYKSGGKQVNKKNILFKNDNL